MCATRQTKVPRNRNMKLYLVGLCHIYTLNCEIQGQKMTEVLMEPTIHNLNNLFDQLGLPSDDASIDLFIQKYRPFTNDILLSDAFFWTKAQASFLREEILNDADWAEVIDQLNLKLHAQNEH